MLTSIEQILTPPFLYKYLHLVYFYDFMSPEDAIVFYEFLIKRDELKREDYHCVSGFINALCYVPFVEVKGENKENVNTTIRNKLLQYFE